MKMFHFVVGILSLKFETNKSPLQTNPARNGKLGGKGERKYDVEGWQATGDGMKVLGS